MTDANEKMVLRTVYLPRDLDDKLRLVAFRSKSSKGDLLRQALNSLLENHENLTLRSAEPPKKPTRSRSASKAQAKADNGEKPARLRTTVAKKPGHKSAALKKALDVV